MIDPRVILIAMAIYGIVWIGGESIKGVRFVKHKIQSAIHAVIHPGQDVRR